MSFLPNVVLHLCKTAVDSAGWSSFDRLVFIVPSTLGILILLGLLRASRPACSVNVPAYRREVFRVRALAHAKSRLGPGSLGESRSPGLYRSEPM